MDININDYVFYGEGFPVDESLLLNLKGEDRFLMEHMLKSGHYLNGIDVSKFLREDLSINLEKLALATTLAVTALESRNTDEDATLNLIGLDAYYLARGISGNSSQEREEKTFILAFVTAEAMEASNRDTLVVKFV